MSETAQQNLKHTLATMAVDGSTPSDEAISLCCQMGEGKISVDEAVGLMRQKHGLTTDTP